ncbi:MAG: hypothetical protein V1774_08160 [Candidatus Eisenbacteria bacterium]
MQRNRPGVQEDPPAVPRDRTSARIVAAAAGIAGRCYPILIWLAIPAAVLPGLLDGRRALAPDSFRYLSLARGLVVERSYSNADGTPHVTTPPLYPAVATLAVIGKGAKATPADSGKGAPVTRPGAGASARVDPHGIVALCLLQALLLIGSAGSLRRISESCGYSPPISRAIALLYCLSPLPLLYAGRVLSETLFVALLLGGGSLAASLWAGPGRWSGVKAFGAGALWGLAALTRAILLPWILMVPLLVLFWRGRRREALVLLLGCFCVLAPWSLRNAALGAKRADLPWGMAAAMGSNALDYAARLVASPEQIDAALAAARGPDPLSGPFAESRARFRAAWHLIADRPGRFLSQAARTFPAFWAPPIGELRQTLEGDPHGRGTLEILRERGLREAVRHTLRDGLSPAVLVLGAFDLAITLVGLAGGAILVRRRFLGRRAGQAALPSGPSASPSRARGVSIPVVWLVLSAVLWAVLLIAPLGAYHPRFRVPLSPWMALFAAGWFARPRQLEARAISEKTTAAAVPNGARKAEIL